MHNNSLTSIGDTSEALAGALSAAWSRLAVGQELLVLRRIGSNAVRGSSGRHQVSRFAAAGLDLAACSWGAGCERRPWIITEAFDIPSPSPALLARHNRPACDFGAPEEIPDPGSYVDQSAKGALASDDAIEALDALSQERDC